jgi:predicted N-acetyltransferase YhbS
VERTWRALTAPGSVCIVALADDSVVGIAHVLSDGEIQAFLAVLLVGRANRQSGIGTRLVREALALAGAKRMDLTSCADAFYETLGFRRVSGFRIARGD